jgi:tRNA(Ile)-lysidine synthase
MLSLYDAFAEALTEIRHRVDSFQTTSAITPDESTSAAASNRLPFNGTSMAVALSGGLDSAVLLHVARQFSQMHGVTLHAFHVHHGLSANADSWLQHCRKICEEAGIAFDSRHVSVTNKDQNGVEEAARLARYAALGAMCIAHAAPLLLTAHHLDDQAETVLLQLLRGSGVAGLSGMDIANRAPDMLGSHTLMIARPLLSLSRGELEHYAGINGISHVEDESNCDPRYARNALRHNVMPVLRQYFPGFQQRFARAAQHAQAAQGLLIELAAQDFAFCSNGDDNGNSGDALDVDRIRQLDPDRTDNLLRYWFGMRGMRMPSTAWLHEMRDQFLNAKADAQLCVTHPNCHIRRHRNRVYLIARNENENAHADPLHFVWRGEAMLAFPALGGSLYFDNVDVGIDASWLHGRNCVIHLRQGGERLKLAQNRPTKSLKYHYQAMDVPTWERERLPLVSSDGKLLYVAGVGMDCGQISAGNARIRFRWVAD